MLATNGKTLRCQPIVEAIDHIIAHDPLMEAALDIAMRAASSRATVLIRGESGTGKELVARAIHNASPRADRPFVAINCAALNKGLIESELFGHEKGAFTGAAHRRVGRFEQANGGTLFIDELAEIPAEVQVKLLRVLQERKIERVGSGAEVDVDVRLVGATHCDLKAMVVLGKFREDLFYRLNVISVDLPPLRSRKRDIPLLVEYFLSHYAEENGKHVHAVSQEAMTLLLDYPYPGNVRELQNIIERAVVMTRNEMITCEELPIDELGHQEILPPTTLPEQVEELEKKAIAKALRQALGIQNRAAEILGLTERNLRYKLKKYGFKRTQ